MNTVFSYLVHADDVKKPILESQWKETLSEAVVTCPCGRKQYVHLSYRCLYCGIWFCVFCAQEHFGQTIDDYYEKKRIKLAKKLKTLSEEQIITRMKTRKSKLSRELPPLPEGGEG